MTPATTDNFNKARLGSAAMEACGACGQATGTILMKRKGDPNGPEYRGSRLVLPNYAKSRHDEPETPRCEFCDFVGRWMADKGIDSGSTKVGAAKIVEGSARELLAYVPFTEADLVENPTVSLIDGTKHPWRHRMVIRATKNAESVKLVEILEQGI